MASILTSEKSQVAGFAGPTREGDIDCSQISFRNISAERVRITAVLCNRGGMSSAPTELSLQAAPLGAFLPWKPLLSLPVPALRPGKAITLEAQAGWPQRQSLGNFCSVLPSDLLAALAADDRRLSQRRTRRILLSSGLLRRAVQNTRYRDARGPVLPPDPLELLGRRNPHWAGNLNVFVGGRSIEKHRAQSLRVYPGRTNCALLCVGAGNDAYRFQLAGIGQLWDVRIHNRNGQTSLHDDTSAAEEIQSHQWVPTQHRLLITTAIHPPRYCVCGDLEVRVTQRSTGKTVVVEFSLDPGAKGPGCYVV